MNLTTWASAVEILNTLHQVAKFIEAHTNVAVH